MQRFFLTTAIALGLAAPAFAGDQLALSTGVQPGTFTTAQLIRLRTAQDDGDHYIVDQMLRHGGSAFTEQSTAPETAEGKAQLAASLGVDGSRYTTGQLTELKQAVDSGDQLRIQQITAQAASAGAPAATMGMNDGHQQLAASLGVDGSRYTTGQLVELKQAMDNNNQSRIRAIEETAALG